MPDIVDALLVSLGLDATQFNIAQKQAMQQFKQTRDEAERTAKDMEARGKQAAQFFSSVKTEALGLMGVLLGGKGLESFTRDAVTSISAIGRAAQNIGMATPELAAFRNMIVRNGGSADSATASFRSMTDEMERFKVTGQSSLIKFLYPIGAQRGDSAMTVYNKFAEWADKHRDDKDFVPLSNFIGKGLGYDDSEINEARKGIAQVKKDMAESYTLGVPTQEMSENMQHLQHDWEALRQAADNVGNTILDKMQPALSGILNTTKDLIVQNPVWAQHIGEVGTALTILGGIRVSASMMGLTGLAGVIDGLIAGMLRIGLLAPLVAFVGPAGGVDPVFSEEKNEEFRKNNDTTSGVSGWWQRTMPTWLGGHKANQADPVQLRDYFRKQGWTDNQTTGILANFKAESAMDAANIGDKGAAAGLGMWRDERRKRFFEMYGHDVSVGTPMEQAQYTQWELTHTEKAAGDALRKTTTKSDAAAVVSRQFERPKDQEGAARLRAQYADNWDDGNPPAAAAPPLFSDKQMANVRAGKPANDGATSPITPGFEWNKAGVPFRPDPSLEMGAKDRIDATTTHNDHSSDVSIGTLIVHTQATDPKGIAHSIGSEISENMRLQADRGLN